VQQSTRVGDLHESGYDLARMAFEIVLAPEAVTALKNLIVPIRSGVTDALERHLTHEPTKISKSRIKRLRGLSQPQYRLRVGDIRVFYDVTETQVQVLAIVTKAEAQRWLDEQGTPTEDKAKSGGPRGSQG
jgi:mRNA interferase RelE/StbE